jgi:hypothetical protein
MMIINDCIRPKSSDYGKVSKDGMEVTGGHMMRGGRETY